jgi:hypothetical protein
MKTAAHGDPPPALPLGPLPAHLLHTEVLRRLGPTDLASFAGAGRGCAAAVAATVLMQWAKLLETTAAYGYLKPLCVLSACSHAACCGNREVLEWLHNTGCPWDTSTCRMAAMGGHLEVLQWVREHGCPWDALTCASAARSGHLRMLQWAREQHCPWNSGTCYYRRSGRAPRGVAVGAGARLPVGQNDLHIRRSGRATGGAAVGAGTRRDRRGLERAPRASLRRWAKEAGGAHVAGPAPCCVKSIQYIQAAHCP